MCEKSAFEIVKGYDGFWDEKYYYLLPSNVYDKTQHLLGMMHMYFPLDMQETVAALKDEGFIKEHSNGKSKKTNYARTLSIEEAAEYFRIGQKRLRQLVEDNPTADYVLMNGNRVQIKRKLFEAYIDVASTV